MKRRNNVAAKRRTRPRKSNRRLGLETLEQRRLLATYVVDSELDNLTGGDGRLTLREAIDLSNSSSGADTIEFAPSLRGQTIRMQQIQGDHRPFSITDDVAIIGPGANNLTIDATGQTRLFDVERSELQLVGLTLTGGNARGGAEDNGLGGAIYNDAGVVRLDATAVRDNIAAVSGGAIYSAVRDDYSAVVALESSFVAGNSSQGDGGAIHSLGGVVQVFNSTLLDNRATDAGVSGGAISADDARVLVAGSTVSGNQAAGSGGGIYVEGGSLQVRTTTIDENTAELDGGGIYTRDAEVEILKTSIVLNEALRNGGGVFVFQNDTGAVMRIDTTTVSGNGATGSGGGVYVDAAAMEILSSTIARNFADSDSAGGGVGGGLRVWRSETLVLHNTLVAENRRGASTPNDIVGAVNESSTANLVSHADTAGGLVEDPTDNDPTNPPDRFNLVGRDPQIGDLAQNGGPTVTHELLAGSPAVDAGNKFQLRDENGEIFQNTIDIREVKDQRGITRLRNPFDDILDIGAYERRTDVDNYYAGDFSVAGVSQFGLGIGLVERSERFTIPFSTGDVTIGGFTDILDAPTGLEIDFGASGEAGVEVGFFVDTGSVNANYSANLTQSYQEPEAIGTVRLDARVDYPTASFNTTSPGFGAYADLILNLQGHLEAQGCLVGVCGTIGDEFDVDLGQELAAINRNRDGQIRINEEEIPTEGEVQPPFSINVGKLTRVPPLDGSIDGECASLDGYLTCKETLSAEIDKKLAGEKFKNLTDLSFDLAEFRQAFPPIIELGSTSASADGVLNDASTRADISPCNDQNEPLPPGVDQTFLASFCVQAGNMALIAAGKPPLAGPISYEIGISEEVADGDAEFSASLIELEFTPLGLELGPALYASQEASVTPVSTITYTFDQPVTICPSGGGPCIEDTTTYTIPAATATQGSFLDIEFTGKPIQVDAVWNRGIDLHNLIELDVSIEGLLTVLDIGIDSDLIDFEAIGLDLDPDPLFQEDFKLLEFPPITVINKIIPLLRQQVPLESFTIGETFSPSLNVTRKDDSGAGSLRNAVESARLLDEIEKTDPTVEDVPHAIYLDAGTYVLDVSNVDNPSIGGDLDVMDSDLTIVGAGSGQTTIVANGLFDRIFDVHAGSKLNLVGVNLVNGNPDAANNDGDHGGSIRNRGELHLEDVAIRNASASSGNGGAIFNDAGATLHIVDSTIQDSTAKLFGGAIYNVGETTLQQSTLANNTAQFGGGVYNEGDISILASTITANRAIGEDGESVGDAAGGGGGGAGLGGGVFSEAGSLYIANSTLSANQAIGGDGGSSLQIWDGSAQVGGRGGGPNGGAGGNLVTGAFSQFAGFGSGGGGGGTGPTSVAYNGGSVSSGSVFGGGGGGAGYRNRLGANDSDNFADTNNNVGGGRGADSLKGSRRGGAGGGGGGIGGGLFHHGGSVTIASSTIVNNSAIGGKAGISSQPGQDGFGVGGGVYVFDGEVLDITGSILANNRADQRLDTNYDLAPGDKNLLSSINFDEQGTLYTGQANGLGQPADRLNHNSNDSGAGIIDNDVALSNDPAAARFGNSSIQFGPTTTLSTIEMPDTDFFNREFTFAAYVRVEGTGRMRLFSAYDGLNTVLSDEMLFDFLVSNTPGSGSMRFLFGSQSVSSSVTIMPGQYYHLAATFDHGQARIYLNGQSVGSGSYANNIIRLRRNLRIGEDSGGSFNEQLIGNVDDALVLKRALTGPEIAQLAAEGAVAFFSPQSGDLINVDPQLAPLGDYGGPTLTHALLPGSPAIGAGDVSLLPRDQDDNLLPDQRGFDRAAADIGATAVIPGSVQVSADGSAGPFSLRQAITVFNVQGGTNTINLAPGTYSLADVTRAGAGGDSAQTGDLDIIGQTLTIVGAGAGQTIIDASAIDDRVFDVHAGAALNISGATIQGGAADPSQSGGGIRNAGVLNLTDAVVTQNTATTGGGIYNMAGGEAAVIRTTISSNTAQWGGGLHNQGMLDLLASSLLANVAIGAAGLDAPRNIVDQGGQGGGGGGGGAGLGGAIFQDQGDAGFANVTIALNKAIGGAGGDGVDNSQNRPFGPGGDGGGIGGGDAGDPNSLQGQMADDGQFGGGGGGGGSVTGTASPIGGAGGLGAGGGGGGAIVNPGSGNGGAGGAGGLGAGAGGTGSRETDRRLAAGAGGGGGAGIGGGIFQSGGVLTILSSTIVENSSSGGAGGQTQVTGNNSPNLVDNNPGADGTGVAGGVFVDAAGVLNVTNTIVAGNDADTSTDVRGVFVSQQGNLIGAASAANGFGASDQFGSEADPLNAGLAALADNGGPTLTAMPTVNSPAIDRGASTSLSLDQRGEDRLDGGGVDVGAVETIDIIEEFVVTVEEDLLGVSSLRQAIIDANAMPGPQIIDLRSGAFTLTLTGAGELQAATGDLNILDDLTIIGFEPERTIIDASALGDRVFNVASGVSFHISGVSIRGGSTTGNGGGLLNAGSTVLESVEFENNVAARGGGISNVGELYITRSTILENASILDGGGVHNHFGTVLIENSTISTNHAGATGGGVFADPASTWTRFFSTTITANTADTAAGGFIVAGTGFSRTEKTIVANNSAPAAPDVGGSLHSNGFNLLGDSSGVTDQSPSDVRDVDPLLGPLQNNGGLTRTHLPSDNSPVVNAGGELFTLPGAVPLDQRGSPRDIGGVDIGSVELRKLIVDRFDDDLAPGSLRSAVRTANSTTGFDTITLGPGVFALTLHGAAGESFAASGDLDVRDNLAIRGAGADETIIDASALGDRAFEIFDNVQFTLFGVTVRGGNTSGDGGAIRNTGTTTISHVGLTENEAVDGGAVANSGQGDVKIIQSAIYNNQATASGGGLYNDAAASMTIVNSTVSTNEAQNGGGIVNENLSAAARIEFSTIAFNVATIDGGGARGNLSLWHTIVAQNAAPSSPDISGSVQSDGYNLVQNTVGVAGLGGSDLTGDPLLGPLQVNGGRTPTHELLVGSPAVDAGDDSLDNGPPLDQRDYSREQGVVDIGAFERQLDFTLSLPTGKSASLTIQTTGMTRVVVAEAGIDVQIPTPDRSLRLMGGLRNDQVVATSLLPQIDLTFDVGDADDVVTALPGQFQQILGGEGFDAWALPGANNVFALASLPAGALDSVEEIDIGGSGPNSLTVDGASVAAFSGASGPLSIRYDDDDTINFAGIWTAEGPQFVDDRYFHIVQSSGAELRVANTRAWQNPINDVDSNRDGFVAPDDILSIINALIFGGGARPLPTPQAGESVPSFYIDATGDNFLAPDDALRGINFINAGNQGFLEGEGEGEGENIQPDAALRTAAAARIFSESPQQQTEAAVSAPPAFAPWLHLEPLAAVQRPRPDARDSVFSQLGRARVAFTQPPSLVHRAADAPNERRAVHSERSTPASWFDLDSDFDALFDALAEDVVSQSATAPAGEHAG